MRSGGGGWDKRDMVLSVGMSRILLTLSAILAAGLPVLARDLPLEKIQLPPGFRIEVYAGAVPGARSMTLGEKGRALSYEPFAQGWLEGGKAWGRPVDVQELPDGSLLVSDDKAGCIYRIAYSVPPGEPAPLR